VAFRKILKKYRKWTGSSALGSRFRESVLSNPKSFTKRSFSQLQARHDGLLATLQASTPPDLSRAVSPTTVIEEPQVPLGGEGQTAQEAEEAAPIGGYWNEYDNGSEAGDFDGGFDNSYAIYIDPSEDEGFPGMATLVALFRVPAEKAAAWLSLRKRRDVESGVTAPLLGSAAQPSGGPYGSGTYSATQTDTEAEGDDAYLSSTPGSPRHPRRQSRLSSSSSSFNFPPGYEAHYASFPSVNDQRVAAYRARVLLWATVAAYLGSAILLAVAAVLLSTGRHKLHDEVVAGAAFGAVSSLACACMALGMNITRSDKVPLVSRLLIWTVFTTLCVLNGMLLVVIAGTL
jgi:hypothetical protein